MKIKYKLKQSTSNFKNHFVRDSKVIVAGTLFMFMLLGTTNVFAAPYKIVYDDNVTSNMPEDVKSTTMNDDVNISSNTPTRAGYVFTGWNTLANGTGAPYSASGALIINGTTSNSYKLYAIWKEDKCKPSGTTIETISCMQDISSSNKTTILNSMTTGTAYQLYDKRDDAGYHVAKLADGNIWMLDNLALDPTTATLDILKGNTNASDQTLTYFKNGGGSSPYAASAVSGVWVNYDQNSGTSPRVATGYKDTRVTSYGAGYGRAGVYYNYCAASAGSYCYARGAASGDASEDICPSGWRLPTGGPNGEAQTLASHYTANAEDADSLQYNLSASFAGYFYSGQTFDQNSSGLYWTSTYYASGTKHMYGFNLTSTWVGASNNGNDRFSGDSLRCLAR